MKLIRYLPEQPVFPDGCVLTIGNFDGVHAGHRMVLQALSRQAKKLGLPSVVMCFEPQPIEYFRGTDAPARISTARDKLSELRSVGVDAVYLVRFDDALASMTAEQFVQMLLKKLCVKWLIVGDDFCFGKNRQGNFEYLQRAGESQDFIVQRSDSFKMDGRRVSSTLIRDALGNGQLDQASTYLERRYTMSGRVMHGYKRGRELGFPTANIRVKNRKTPLKGVFAVTITLESGLIYEGVANIGTRPSIEQTTKVLLEAHLFDFSGDLYGQRVVIGLYKKLRGEQKFDGLELLQRQIAIDSEQARLYFNKKRTA